MKRRWPWIAVLVVALGLGLATNTSTQDDIPIPSVANAGPRGARVLFTWLTETSAEPTRLMQPLTSLPADLDVLVIAAPTAREVTEEEVEAIARFVDHGGTLVYLSPRPPRAQPALSKWLGLEETPALFADSTMLTDFAGRTVDAKLPGVSKLRVAPEKGIAVADAEAIAGTSLWRKGRVWVGAGPDLVENRRLDLLDNLAFWASFRGKRIGFDEFHHGAGPAPRWSANLWATLFQFVFVGLLFVASRARRLGPARPTLERQHRSSLEYVQSMGALMQRAGVEGELKLKLRDRLRRLMQERLGIPMSLSADEASRLLSTHAAIPPDAYARLDLQLGEALGDFVAATAEAARLEDIIVGRKA